MFLKWIDDRTGLTSAAGTIGRWTVPAGKCACRYLPAMIVFGILVQGITGIFLWTHYSTSAASAWESVFYMQYILPGGWLVRGLHHFSAQLVVFLLGLNLLVMVFQGKYRAPREFVFWANLVLLLFCLASCLTGDLLTWTLNGYSATKVRVNFLLMLPVLGEPLFKIVAGGPDFGTLTIPRFLVLHVLVFGGGGLGIALLWRWFDLKANNRLLAEAAARSPEEREAAACKRSFGCNCSRCPEPVSFWSGEAVKCALAALVFMGMTLLLVYQKPLLNRVLPERFPINDRLPREAALGAGLAAPADPPAFYDAARPEWSFRALYHFSNYFSGTQKLLPIFIIPGGLLVFLLLMPFIGYIKLGHYFNLLVFAFLVLAFGYLTFASYWHDYRDPAMASFRDDEAAAAFQAERTIELCFAPEGIPPGGAVALTHRDPMIQGPILFKQHCASCHPFQPLLENDGIHPEFRPIPCDAPSAPNLYRPVRAHWIKGWLVPGRIKSEDYYAHTKFRKGSMITTYMDGTFRDIQADMKDNGEDFGKAVDQLVAVLLQEARSDGPRLDGKHLSQDDLVLVEDFGCLECHWFYNSKSKPAIASPDLRGYMSRRWMIDFIANPADPRFYGPDRDATAGNDRMQAYHPTPDEALLTREEIETLVDWLRGTWYRHAPAGGTEADKDASPSATTPAMAPLGNAPPQQ